MQLAEKIYYYRTKCGMSQGTLAEALDVSRQSISKWETGASVPELDKLIKLSELFGITVDELVKESEPREDTKPNEPKQTGEPQRIEYRIIRESMPQNKIAAYVLLCTGLLLFVLALVLAPWFILFTIPIFACSAVCFICKKNAAFFCCWIVYILFDVYMHYATGATASFVFGSLRALMGGYIQFNITHVVSLIMLTAFICMTVWTVRLFSRKGLEATKTNAAVCVGGWVGYVAFRFGISLLFKFIYAKFIYTGDTITTHDHYAAFMLLNSVNYILRVIYQAAIVLLLIYTARLIRSAKKDKTPQDI